MLRKLSVRELISVAGARRSRSGNRFQLPFPPLRNPELISVAEGETISIRELISVADSTAAES
jgi:hypothetical protein